MTTETICGPQRAVVMQLRGPMALHNAAEESHGTAQCRLTGEDISVLKLARLLSSRQRSSSIVLHSLS